MVEIKRLTSSEAREHLSALAEILVDCVEGGASVSFMSPYSQEAAETFYQGVVEGVERGERILLAAFADRELVGTVQIVTALPPNQPHRADIAKLLVKTSARGQGVGALLIQQTEKVSLQEGKSLLVLDTVTGGDGERLYTRLGWTKSGTIPNYALYPHGGYCATTIFYKQLAEHPPQLNFGILTP